ncbi:hypothetical protein [Streptomyces sulphureus]|uniref:hypothetical protein n=1 Tax=Streptomyces sulphureus TaxID=47758 RepID=UPI0003788169|nr:hypothetical protein [Streptomyces sulphureus]
MARRLTKGLATTVATAGLVLSPALAGAAGASPSGASAPSAGTAAACAPEACWDKGGTFWTKTNCQKDGRDAVRASAKWTAYTCKQSLSNWKYTLYLKPRY